MKLAILIQYDTDTGEIVLKCPPDLGTTLGLIEMAKVKLTIDQIEIQKNMEKVNEKKESNLIVPVHGVLKERTRT